MAEVAIQRTASLAEPTGFRAAASKIAAVSVGNALEVYDFVIYSYFAIYIGHTFFPSNDPNISLLTSLATFGVGFATRPIGAIVIGRLGDRAGRKPAMLLSFALMGVAIVGLALTPSYQSIGVAAPIIAVCFRLVQGFALGGEIGPSTSYLIEAAPALRRGLFVSFQYAGQSFAAILAGLTGVVLTSVMSDGAMRDIGWRLAMLTGALIIPIGLLLRRGLSETLEEPEALPAGAAPGAPTAAPPRLRVVIFAVLMLASGTTVSYVLKYLTTYSIATLHMPARVAFAGPLIGGIVGIFVSPLGGWLSDRFGRKPVMIGPWIFLLFAILPSFYAISHFRTAAVLFASTILLSGVGTIAAASVLVAVTEALPKKVRSAGLALTYAVAVSVFGGSAQFNVAWLTGATHSPLAPAWYMMVGVAIGLVAMLGMRETAPIKLAKSRAH